MFKRTTVVSLLIVVLLLPVVCFAAENKSKPLIIAHRGDCSRAPENTMAAFRLAVEEGVDIIELDVHLTSDGEVVVIHDKTVDRTTNGTGWVKYMTYNEIRELDAGNGEKVPSLIEVIEFLKEEFFNNEDKLLIIEPKNLDLPYEGLEEKIIDIVEKYDVMDNVIICSFNHYSLLVIKELSPSIKIGLTYKEIPIAPWKMAEKVGAYCLNVHYSNITPQLLCECRDRNIKVFPWTVNEVDDMKKLIDLGVDGITTDNPVLLKKVIDGKV